MSKIKIDQRFSPYQMPCVIIGTNVDEKPNFMLCTWVSRVNRNPPVWMASINKEHYTMKGIKKNKIFSMNFPSADLIMKVDYVGITSGREIDKSSLFDIFYGDTEVKIAIKANEYYLPPKTEDGSTLKKDNPDWPIKDIEEKLCQLQNPK